MLSDLRDLLFKMCFCPGVSGALRAGGRACMRLQVSGVRIQVSGVRIQVSVFRCQGDFHETRPSEG